MPNVADGICNIINSTLARNDTHAVYQDGGQVEILNSILFFNNDGYDQIAGSVLATYSDIQNGYTGEGNISYNPIFIDQYHLIERSPCVDAGTANGAPRSDIEGNRRPQGGGYDLGAYEFPSGFAMPWIFLLLND